MIKQIRTFACRKCQSENVVKNGTNASGNQQYHCKDCGAYGVMEPEQQGYSEKEKERILSAYRERGSLRGVERIFGVSRGTILRWPGKKGRELKSLAETLAPARPEDVLELDEAWSFVGKKENKRWLCAEISAMALCRRTGQVVAFAIGDRSAKTCARLWRKIPESYRQCRSFSDFWDAYASVLSSKTHERVDKKSGETSHMERFYCTLRQRLARYVRKTLSFSKSERMHHLVTRWFIGIYNESVT